MWIVTLALRQAHTIFVMALLIIVLGVTTIASSAVDIFPDINIPVVCVIWTYTGMPATDLSERVLFVCERALTTTVDNIEHIESVAYAGTGLIKIFFHPGTDPTRGLAQATAMCQTLLKNMPPGITPPMVMNFSASSVPILQLGLDGPFSEQQLFDYALNFVRTQLATVQGAQIPYPSGGKTRAVMVDLDLEAMNARGVSPSDVSTVVGLQNLILPAGTIKMGKLEYTVQLNASTQKPDHMNDMPVRASQNGGVVRLGDVANVRDGYTVQTNQVHMNTHRSCLLGVIKGGGASTLAIVDGVKKALPNIEATLPPELRISPLFDQSLFVRASIEGVLHEGLTAGALTALMILLFLGSWRSTMVVAISIPLAILVSLTALGALGNTINVMTLGGLALAVGILVDDATVAVENIYRHKGMGKSLYDSVVDGTQEIAVPTLVSTLSICVVFVSVVFLTGPAKFLFTPMALSVVFAMIASYLLSRTLVPLLMYLFLPKETNTGKIFEVHEKFEGLFHRLEVFYVGLLRGALDNRRRTLGLFGLLFAVSACLVPFIGEDFFPSVDSGAFRCKVRAPAGTRIEESEKLFMEIEAVLHELIPSLGLVTDNIGLPTSGINLAFTDAPNAGPYEGEIMAVLNPGHPPTADVVRQLRIELPRRYPNCTFYFPPADMVTQILNFGLPAPIDIQISGKSPANYDIARRMAEQVKAIPGAVDVRVQQVVDAPLVTAKVDRQRALEMGLTQRDIANSLLIALSSSSQTSPNFWLDPTNGVSYTVGVQAPQRTLDSLERLKNIPLSSSQILGNLAELGRGHLPMMVSHYNVQNVYDVLAAVQDRDLGGVAQDVDKIIKATKLPRGTFVRVQGLVQSMRVSFKSLILGIAFAILFVYLLMVVNFQSWLDPFIIITALPGALSGVFWMLFCTHTTFSVPSLMGIIVVVGVAAANSILLVTFANGRIAEGDTPYQAALAAGETRLRPILMTATAMLIGMIPMGLGLGEGGEQNVPLGLAVMGGLMVATFTTLFFVPTNFTLLKRASK